MVIGFLICSIVALIFLGIGSSSRKMKEAVGFFTFVKPPKVENVKQYNRAVSMIWFVAAVVLEMCGIPFLFLEQNSPVFIFMIFAVIILVIGMMAAYLRIETKYRKIDG